MGFRNSVVISGSVVYVKEPTYTSNGDMRLTVFINTDPLSDDANRVPVVLWGDVAEFVNEHASLGSHLIVFGKLVVYPYEKAGQRATFTYVHAEDAMFANVGDMSKKAPVKVPVPQKARTKSLPSRQGGKDASGGGKEFAGDSVVNDDTLGGPPF